MQQWILPPVLCLFKQHWQTKCKKDAIQRIINTIQLRLRVHWFIERDAAFVFWLINLLNDPSQLFAFFSSRLIPHSYLHCTSRQSFVSVSFIYNPFCTSPLNHILLVNEGEYHLITGFRSSWIMLSVECSKPRLKMLLTNPGLAAVAVCIIIREVYAFSNGFSQKE